MALNVYVTTYKHGRPPSRLPCLRGQLTLAVAVLVLLVAEVMIEVDRPEVTVAVAVVDFVVDGRHLDVDEGPARGPVLAHVASVITILLVLPILDLNSSRPGIGVGLSSSYVIHIPSPLP